MDDIWKNNNDRTYPPIPYRTYDSERSSSAFTYLEFFIEKERQIRVNAKNHGTLSLYYKTFGEDLISRHLLEGLKNSYNNYFRTNENKHLKNTIKSSICHYEDLIKDILV